MRNLALATLLLVLSVGTPALAAPAADAILREARRAGGLFRHGAEAEVRLVVTAPGKAPRERRLRSFSREEGGLGRGLVRFEAPPDVAGTAYLWLEQRGRPDEHWLYRPELRRARRIAGAQRHESFMGTDFAYHDLEWREVEGRKHTGLPDEKIGGVPCHVVESRGGGPDDPYGRIVWWVRKEGLVPLRVKFFGRDGKHLKTLFTKKVQKVGAQWVVAHARMTTVATGSTTDLVVEKLEVKEIPAELFSPRALEKE